MEYYFIGALISLIMSALLALIPANVAKNKGRSFGLWWFYGWMLFLIALIHALMLPENNNVQHQSQSFSTADNIKKYKELLDKGIITQEEFESKKQELLKNI